jgi:hypothetical protein
MRRRTLLVCSAAILCWSAANSAHAINLLVNPSFELPIVAPPGPDAGPPLGWSSFNSNHVTFQVPPQDGNQALKQFGPFFNGGGAGVFQDFPALPGQEFAASSWARLDTGDLLGVNNFGFMALEFRNGGTVVGNSNSPNIFVNTQPHNQWVNYSVSGTVPAGANTVRLALLHIQLDPIDGGAIFWDNASLELVPEPTSLSAMLVLGAAVAGFTRRGRRRS